jgi:DNA mismatch endonuclease (patch repair protein)
MTERESWATSARTRKTMQSTRARDTKPELALRSELHRRGRRFRVCARPVREVRRTADIVFTKQCLAVFLDGCFWHGCPDHYVAPKQNSEFWSDKVTTNRLRDRATDAVLTEHGWFVLRIWEHVPLAEAADAVEAALDRLGAS